MIVQGVYELFEKECSTEWEDERRLNRLVFIGEGNCLSYRTPLNTCTCKPVNFQGHQLSCSCLFVSLCCLPCRVQSGQGDIVAVF